MTPRGPPTARSAAERRLEMIHDEDEGGVARKRDALQQTLLDREVRLAGEIAEVDRSPWQAALDALAAHDHDGGRLETSHWRYCELPTALPFAEAVAAHPDDPRETRQVLHDCAWSLSRVFDTWEDYYR